MNSSSAARPYLWLAILALSGFVTSFGAHIVATNLPAYATAVGAGAFTIGLLIAAYDFAELFAKPLAGVVADRAGMKLVLLCGLVVFVAGSLLFLVISPRLLLVVRFVQGLGAAALSTVSISLVASYFARNRGTAFGVYNAIKGAGYVVAPAMGGFLTHAYGFRMIFVVSAAIGSLVLSLSLFLPRGNHRAADDEDEPSLRALIRILADPKLLPTYAAIVINMFLVGVLFGFLPVYLHSLDYSTLGAGVILSTATASYLLVQPLAGVLADRFAIRPTVLIGLLAAALSVGAMTFTTGRLLIALVVVAGMGVGTVWTNADTLASSAAPPGRLGMTVGAAQSFKEFGDMVGPLAVGALTQAFGVRVAFSACSVAALVAVTILARSGLGGPATPRQSRQ